jgi:4-amino-4-deoxy-L-arabinose transferase-like glycosyltransferase
MKKILVFVNQHFLLISVSFSYFLTRLLFLTRLPIFNDEAIYINWGWRAWHFQGWKFFSLTDGKQPLLMWLFGGAASFITDPLLAGRLVSVLFGFLTLLGLFVLTKKYFSRRTVVLVGALYIITPLFLFFDRQALMESSLAAVGVWILYVTLLVAEKQKIKDAAILGILLGISFWIKTTGLVFFFTTAFLLTWQYFNQSKSERERHFSQFILLANVTFFVSQLILLPLYVQAYFSLIFRMNSRFTLSISEILHFPILHWFQTLWASLEMIWWYLSPWSLILLLVGAVDVFRSQKKILSSILIWQVLLLLSFIISIRTPQPRYFVSLLPVILIFVAQGLEQLWQLLAHKKVWRVVTLLPFLFPTVVSILLIFSPLQYFTTLEHLTKYSQAPEYVHLWPAGYGVKEALDYVWQKSRQSPVAVAVRVDNGNPESAAMAYFQQFNTQTPQQINVFTLSDKFLTEREVLSDCIVSNKPVYFISRDNQLAGLDHFLQLEQQYWKPGNQNYVSVYKVKSEKICK